MLLSLRQLCGVHPCRVRRIQRQPCNSLLLTESSVYLTDHKRLDSPKQAMLLSFNLLHNAARVHLTIGIVHGKLCISMHVELSSRFIHEHLVAIGR